MTNTNPTTGIRYGVISGNSLDPDVLNELFYGSEAVNVSFNEAYAEAKDGFTREFHWLVEEADISAAEAGADREPGFDADDYREKWFEQNDKVDNEEDYVAIKLERWGEFFECDEPTIQGEYEGVKYTILWLGGAPLVYVVEGPIGYVERLCSPCVPNAGDIDSGYILRDEFNDEQHGTANECYVVPRDWLYNLENR